VNKMPKRMDDVVAYVRKSRNRLDVLKALGRTITTSNKIAARTRLQVGTVRSVLYDLKRKGLVKEAAIKARRPMIYDLTELGSAVVRMKDASGQIRWKGSSKQRRIARRVSSTS
jgi:DNA-binding MarR family transcriptional regulator